MTHVRLIKLCVCVCCGVCVCVCVVVGVCVCVWVVVGVCLCVYVRMCMCMCCQRFRWSYCLVPCKRGFQRQALVKHWVDADICSFGRTHGKKVRKKNNNQSEVLFLWSCTGMCWLWNIDAVLAQKMAVGTMPRKQAKICTLPSWILMDEEQEASSTFSAFCTGFQDNGRATPAFGAYQVVISGDLFDIFWLCALAGCPAALLSFSGHVEYIFHIVHLQSGCAWKARSVTQVQNLSDWSGRIGLIVFWYPYKIIWLWFITYKSAWHIIIYYKYIVIYHNI